MALNEASFNTDLVNAFFAEGGWAYKIEDARKGTAYSSAKRPFDGFGIIAYEGHPLEIKFESKFLKGYQAFNLDRLAPHQYDNLLEIDRIGGNAVVPLAIREPSKLYDIFLFSARFLMDLKLQGISCITKKQLLACKEKGYAVTNLRRATPLTISEIYPRLIDTQEAWL